MIDRCVDRDESRLNDGQCIGLRKVTDNVCVCGVATRLRIGAIKIYMSRVVGAHCEVQAQAQARAQVQVYRTVQVVRVRVGLWGLTILQWTSGDGEPRRGASSAKPMWVECIP